MLEELPIYDFHAQKLSLLYSKIHL